MNKVINVGMTFTAALALVSCSTPDALKQEAGATLQAQSASATAGVLNLNFAFGVPSAKVIVGPAQGRVAVFGLPSIADGTVYNGIRAINWRSGAGNDGVQFEVTQVNDFDITVDTGSSDADVQAKWIIPAGANASITPSINITTGAGMKKVQVDLESFTRAVNFGLVGRMGAGPTEFKGDLQFKQGSVNASAAMDFAFSGNQGDKAELVVDNEASVLDLNLSPRLMNELVTKVLGDDPAVSARVRFQPVSQAGGSKIGFDMVSSAPNITLDHTITGGAGMDDVSLSLGTIRVANVTSNVNLRLGEGNDKLDMKYTGLPSNYNLFRGPIQLGGGNDEAKLEFIGGTNYGFSLDCGAGVDKAIGFRVSTVGCELN